jgi:hypothetical protein
VAKPELGVDKNRCETSNKAVLVHDIISALINKLSDVKKSSGRTVFHQFRINVP